MAKRDTGGFIKPYAGIVRTTMHYGVGHPIDQDGRISYALPTPETNQTTHMLPTYSHGHGLGRN